MQVYPQPMYNTTLLQPMQVYPQPMHNITINTKTPILLRVFYMSQLLNEARTFFEQNSE